MKKTLHIFLAIAFWTLGIIHTFTWDKAPSKLTPVQAIRAAEQQTGGKAKAAIVEQEKGEWVYGIFVEKNEQVSEVNVHPGTGKVGTPETILPHDEANEFKDTLSKPSK